MAPQCGVNCLPCMRCRLAWLPILGRTALHCSVLAARASLRPHFGVTNGQLKLHYGLIVPAAPSAQPCAVRPSPFTKRQSVPTHCAY